MKRRQRKRVSPYICTEQYFLTFFGALFDFFNESMHIHTDIQKRLILSSRGVMISQKTQINRGR